MDAKFWTDPLGRSDAIAIGSLIVAVAAMVASVWLPLGLASAAEKKERQRRVEEHENKLSRYVEDASSIINSLEVAINNSLKRTSGNILKKDLLPPLATTMKSLSGLKEGAADAELRRILEELDRSLLTFTMHAHDTIDKLPLQKLLGNLSKARIDLTDRLRLLIKK